MVRPCLSSCKVHDYTRVNLRQFSRTFLFRGAIVIEESTEVLVKKNYAGTEASEQATSMGGQ